MRVELAYGAAGLAVEVPDGATVLRPTALPALADPEAAVHGALQNPVAGPALATLAATATRVAVVFPDLTRPMPNRVVLPPVLEALAAAGVADDAITLLCATGTHRQATAAEMRELIGPDLAARYAVVDHDAGDTSAHLHVGNVDGVPILLQRDYVEADLRVITGFVEPHFFAGFSGGPKAVCPGLAAASTILEAHHPRRIAAPSATFLTRHGNPVHDFVRTAVALAPPHFSLDVAIDGERRLTAAFGGSLTAAHDAACAAVEASAVHRVDHPFDVVVSTNAGHPLDRNLYQAVKGMAAAERIVRPGGVIIMAAACCDGFPDGGSFARIVSAARHPDDLLGSSSAPELDRWQAQVLGRVLRHAQVWLRSDGIDDRAAERAFLKPVHDMSAAVGHALRAAGGEGSVAVLPEGPLTVATVATRS